VHAFIYLGFEIMPTMLLQGESYMQDGSIFHRGEFENGRAKREKKGEKKGACVLQ
jgi:hypothetical protein